MIHVDRTAVEPPERLTDPDGAGVAETKQALAFYDDPANSQKKFDFKEYRKPDVKDLLIALFHGKCAYCQDSASSSHDGDVEHFRPKGAVLIDGKVVKPGYYWLAAYWDNLFLSCQHCNQKRKHRVEGGGTLNAGKANKFPVADEKQRVRPDQLPDDLIDGVGALDLDRLGAVCADEPYHLIDPCHDNPSDHLQFLSDGMVRPTFTASGEPDPMGDASITTFGLHRPQLANERAAQMVTIGNELEFARMAVEKLDNDPNDAFAQQILDKALAALDDLCQPVQRFSGMARQLVDRFVEELAGP